MVWLLEPPCLLVRTSVYVRWMGAWITRAKWRWQEPSIKTMTPKMTSDHDDAFRQTERGALVSASYRRLRLRGLTVDLTILSFLAFSNSGRREASLCDHARHPRSSSDLPGDENCCCQEGQGGREIKGIFAGPKPEKVNRGWRYFCHARCWDVETGIWGWRSRCRFVSVGSWA